MSRITNPGRKVGITRNTFLKEISMDAATVANGAIKKARGRKDSEKQEAVTKPQVIEKRIEELVRGYRAAQDAAEDSSNAIKKAAEDSGYNTKSVRALVVARAGESFQEKKRDLEQQMELFSEVGE